MALESTAAQPISLGISSPDKRLNVYDLSPERLIALMAELGEPAYRAKQVLHWLYKELATDFSAMTNLPLDLRLKLAERLKIGSAELVSQKISSDGWTRKVLLKMRDGNTVEAVLMLYYDRATVCISSQVGCAMGCTFCATGQMGFTRNLSSGEIIEQVIWFNRWLRDHPHVPTQTRNSRYLGRPATGTLQLRTDSRQPASDNQWFGSYDAGNETSTPITGVTNVVFMGMGEPLVNYNNLWAAIRTLNSPQGLGLGARRLTVSTVGIVPGINRFAQEKLAVNLAVSLHAPNDELRGSFMPINMRYSVDDLIQACHDYVSETHRRITFEYVLINGVNDSLTLAAELRDRLRGLLCHVNLIPLNPVPGTGMKATPREQVYAFQKVLEDAGIHTTVRIERGVDIAAACGQLKVEEEPGSRRRSLNPNLIHAHAQTDLATLNS